MGIRGWIKKGTVPIPQTVVDAFTEVPKTIDVSHLVLGKKPRKKKKRLH